MRKTTASFLVSALTFTFIITPVVGSVADPSSAEVTTQVLDVEGVSAESLDDSSALQEVVEDPAAPLLQSPSDPSDRSTQPPTSPPETAQDEDSSPSTTDPAPSTADPAPSPERIDTQQLAALSAAEETKPFMLAGITWDADTNQKIVSADARLLENGEWTAWSALDVLPTQPGDTVAGTEPLISGGATGVQVRVLTESGTSPDGLEVTLVDPGESGADDPTAARSTVASTAGAVTSTDLKPAVIPRESWMGAGEEKYTTWDDEYSSRLDAMYVHHTAGSNSYTASDGAKIVRGIYSYHAKSLKWGDIGYQFLVDKYGNIFEGRHDAIEALPVGAQAGGYNSGTIGVSAIGNYQTAQPTTKLVEGITKVLAWKAYENDLDARATVKLLTGSASTNSLKYAIGSWVSVPTILGHKDTNATACPGVYLYSQMNSIRASVAKRVDALNAKYGPYQADLDAPRVAPAQDDQYPALLSEKLTLTWDAVPGAKRYQVLTRLAGKGGELGRDISYTVHKDVTSTKTTLTFQPGQTRYMAIRAIGAGGHSTAVKVSQVTRPVDATSATRSTGWSTVTSSTFYPGKTVKATKAGRTLDFGTVSKTRKIAIVGKSGPNYGDVQVLVGGTVVRSASFDADTVNSNAVKTVDLGKVRSGKVVLKTVGTANAWVISGASFLPVEQGAKVPTLSELLNPNIAPGVPKLDARGSDQTPITLFGATSYSWSPVPAAENYEIGVKEVEFTDAWPSVVTPVATTSEVTYQRVVPAGYSSKVYVRAVNSAGKKSAWASATLSTRPPSGNSLIRSQAPKKWTKLSDAKYYKSTAFKSRIKGATITVEDVQRVKSVGLMVSTSPGSGRLAVYAGSTKVATISLKSSGFVSQKQVVVKLPKMHTGDIRIQVVDAKDVRVSAITPIK